MIIPEFTDTKENGLEALTDEQTGGVPVRAEKALGTLRYEGSYTL